MKKPNITKGEWFICDDEPRIVTKTEFIDSIKTFKICSFDHLESDWMNDPDVKAIRAVPGMIAALMEAHEATHHSICGLEWKQENELLHFNEADGEHLIWLRKVERITEKALKKAGCTDITDNLNV